MFGFSVNESVNYSHQLCLVGKRKLQRRKRKYVNFFKSFININYLFQFSFALSHFKKT